MSGEDINAVRNLHKDNYRMGRNGHGMLCGEDREGNRLPS